MMIQSDLSLKNRLENEDELRGCYEALKSQIRVWPCLPTKIMFILLYSWVKSCYSDFAMEKIYKRYINDSVDEDLKNKMVFVGGPRQVGKTTFALTFLSEPDEKHPAYLNWDDVLTRSSLMRGELPPNQDMSKRQPKIDPLRQPNFDPSMI